MVESNTTDTQTTSSDDVHRLILAAPESQRKALADETRRQLYKENLFAFAKYFLGYKEIVSHAHIPVIEALEAPTKRKLIVMPRGTFKSTIGVVCYSLWLLIRNPNERILIDSELYTNSRNFLREIKLIIAGDNWTKLWGNWVGDIWTESEIVIKPRTKNYKEASITCSGIGATKVGQHFSVIIGDDYNSNNNSQTVEGRQKIIDHYRLNQSILEPDGKYIIIGTRYATDDIIGFILENEIRVGIDASSEKTI